MRRGRGGTSTLGRIWPLKLHSKPVRLVMVGLFCLCFAFGQRPGTTLPTDNKEGRGRRDNVRMATSHGATIPRHIWYTRRTLRQLTIARIETYWNNVEYSELSHHGNSRKPKNIYYSIRNMLRVLRKRTNIFQFMPVK